MKKRFGCLKFVLLFLLILFLLFFVLIMCSPDDASENPKTLDDEYSVGYSPDDTWAVYWYLCGSDLESEYGAATADLAEMMEVTLPENIKVVIQTGGANAWQNDVVSAERIERYVYSSDGLERVGTAPIANMGAADTLADFLSFCDENYPADHTMVLFWNHGGGSVAGAAFDERYEFDSLTLDEMHDAFSRVYTLSHSKPPFEVVGFDTCLMATIENAYTFSDISRYLVASEELEPGNGWDYSGWLGALCENPGMNGAQLGKAICDTYLEDCRRLWTDGDITLSVTDLSKIGGLLDAYNSIGDEALWLACENPMFFARFGRAASRSENYGGNTPDAGYTDMVDLGHLVRNSRELFPDSSDELLNALDECVVYKVSGCFREEATGLSCYYSYSDDYSVFEDYADIGVSDGFVYLYDYELSGRLSDDGMRYVNSLGYNEDTVKELPTGDAAGLADHPLTVDDDGNATLTLGADTAELLQAMYIELCYLSEEDDIMLILGRDNDLDADWENGVFKDNFRGVWGSIDGHLCYMEIIYEGDDYNIYSVPILLNGEEYNLRVAYSFTDEEYKILGARKGLDFTGMADKNLVKLKTGDEITTLHYATTFSGDDAEAVQIEVETFKVTDKTEFYDAFLGDGMFLLMFEMVDAAGDSYYSEMAIFEIENGEIYTYYE